MELKSAVRKFWSSEPCGTRYLESYEAHAVTRTRLEPHIHEFAGFADSRGLRVLEIGTGMGADYIEWLKAGADAYGIDLSESSICHARRRCQSYAGEVKLLVADAENLPFEDGSFDLVYSYGVMHHSPDTRACIREAHRILKPGAKLRVMVYHHPSLVGLMLWLRFGIVEGKRIRRAVFDHLESPGTKTFTGDELRAMLEGFTDIKFRQAFSPGDLLMNQASKKFASPLYSLAWKFYPRALLRRCASGFGLFLMASATRV